MVLLLSGFDEPTLHTFKVAYDIYKAWGGIMSKKKFTALIESGLEITFNYAAVSMRSLAGETLQRGNKALYLKLGKRNLNNILMLRAIVD